MCQNDFLTVYPPYISKKDSHGLISTPRVPMLLALTLHSLVLLVVATASFQPAGIPFKLPVTATPGFSAEVIFSNLTNPRGIVFDVKGNLLVIERGVGVTGFQSVEGGWMRTVVVNNTGLTHGIEVDRRNLYVSSAGQVLLYAYDPETMSIIAGTAPVIIVDGLPPDGGEYSLVC
jgi:hypothetical protein